VRASVMPMMVSSNSPSSNVYASTSTELDEEGHPVDVGHPDAGPASTLGYRRGLLGWRNRPCAVPLAKPARRRTGSPANWCAWSY
jgi:hypothetical protein